MQIATTLLTDFPNTKISNNGHYQPAHNTHRRNYGYVYGVITIMYKKEI